MQYVKANRQPRIIAWLSRLSAISTVPARTYPPPLEGLIDLSHPRFAPLRSAFHRISSTRSWWTSKAIE